MIYRTLKILAHKGLIYTVIYSNPIPSLLYNLSAYINIQEWDTKAGTTPIM